MAEKLAAMQPENLRKKKSFWERNVKPMWAETHNSSDDEDEDEIEAAQKHARRMKRKADREAKALLDAKMAAAESGSRLAV